MGCLLGRLQKKKKHAATPPDKEFSLGDMGTFVAKNRGGLCLVDLSRTKSGAYFFFNL